jgi:hypothetical protein
MFFKPRINRFIVIKIKVFDGFVIFSCIRDYEPLSAYQVLTLLKSAG